MSHAPSLLFPSHWSTASHSMHSSPTVHPTIYQTFVAVHFTRRFTLRGSIECVFRPLAERHSPAKRGNRSICGMVVTACRNLHGHGGDKWRSACDWRNVWVKSVKTRQMSTNCLKKDMDLLHPSGSTTTSHDDNGKQREGNSAR